MTDLLNFKDILIHAFTSNGFCPSEVQLSKFIKYYENLSTANKLMNLTTITEPSDVIYKHFLDSIIPAKHIPLGSNVADIGSGAGFPGIPLKIMSPDLSITLIESTKKKANFIQSIIDDLNLTDCIVVPDRAEAIGRDEKYRGSFDIVTARALAPLNVLLEYAMPLLKIGGSFISYKGPNYTDEITDAASAAKALGAEFIIAEERSLLDASRLIIIYKKIKEIGSKYPRNTSQIVKKPLS